MESMLSGDIQDSLSRMNDSVGRCERGEGTRYNFVLYGGNVSAKTRRGRNDRPVHGQFLGGMFLL